MSRLLAILLAASLSACGMKGGLERPPGPPREPLLGNKPGAAPAPAPAVTPEDVSTDPKARSQ